MFYSNVYVGLATDMFASCSKRDLMSIICKINFFSKLTTKLEELERKKTDLKTNNQDLQLVFIKKLITSIKTIIDQRPELSELKESLGNMQNYSAFTNLLG